MKIDPVKYLVLALLLVSISIQAQPLLHAISPETPLDAAGVAPQGDVALGVSSHGFLAAWSSLTGTYARRVSFAGAPVDEPFQLEGKAAYSIRITSDGETYVISWRSELYKVRFQRFNASTGACLDSVPRELPFTGGFQLASNGTDALLFYNEWQSGIRMRARVLRLSGEMFPTDPIALASDDYQGDWGALALASNGEDFLAVWPESHLCNQIPSPPCYQTPTHIRMLRLRADGTRIDAAPVVVVDRQRDSYPFFPSVAWNGDRYTLVWSDMPTVRGVRISGEGAILENGTDGRGTVLDEGQRPGFALAAIVPLGSRNVLITRNREEFPRNSSQWLAAAFKRDLPLADIGNLARAVMAESNESSENFSVPAVSSGRLLLIGYSRRSSDNQDPAPRAYVRLFRDEQRRRSVAR